MNNIDTRSPFFPNSKTGKKRTIEQTNQAKELRRNSAERAQELKEKTSGDAKVSISSKIKDFSRIKSAVDQAAPIDNSDKIADLKARIQAGTYEPDYDAIAEKLLTSEY